MSTYAISDIHGHDKTFRSLLKKINLKKTDKLVLLGDLIDRGSDSKKVLDTVLLLIESGFDVICLMGNHEELFLKAFEDFSSKMVWLKNGGNQTLSSFLTSDLEKIPQVYIELIKNFKMYYEEGRNIFVHAGIDMTKEEPLSDKKSLLWLRNWKEKYNADWLKDRKVIHGHNPMSSSEIIDQPNMKESVFCIDNGCFLDKPGFGGLCALNVDTFEFIFQQKEK